MLSLMLIRIKYIIRHPCLLFWTYLCVPIGIIILAIIKIKDKKALERHEKVEPFKFEEIISFPESNSYDYLLQYWEYTAFLVDKGIDKTKMNDILNSLTSTNILCLDSESIISNKTLNIINIKMKDNKFRIYLTSRNTNLTQTEILNNNFKFFENSDLDQNTIINPFYINSKDYPSNLPEKNKLLFGLQSLLSNALIKYNKGINADINYGFIMQFGYNSFPPHYRFTDDYGIGMSSLYGFLMTLQISLITFNFNLRMIDEKENKLNILLERQGISKFKYNISWLITFYVLFAFTIISFLLLILGTIQFHQISFIISLILFTLSIYSTCVFFTTCIKSVKTGTTAVKFFNFGAMVLGIAIIHPGTPKIAKIIFAFIPQINLYSTIYCIFCLNNFNFISLELLWLRASKMSYLETCIMFIADIIIYLGLSIFIQAYKESGLSFCQFLKSFFTKVSRDPSSHQKLIHENEDNKGKTVFQIHHQELSSDNQQKLEQNQCLRIINVSKNFEDLKAVDNFTGELFSNEIFCLLGHNGAGKSTLINMISGFFDPDYGDILLNGKSLVTDKNYLYQNIGLCQQEDIFFDYLTVEEHLEYMCRIKGSKINKEDINQLINQIELAPKKQDLCKNLSGGQKRKLCIALALIGDSKIILLDEPTSGMDIMARKSLWEFLKNYKKNKIILLTTHFLDEAEYLGDRIGIMCDGHFLCSGTSSFLKSKYPCGFNINLLINSSIFNEDYKQQFYNRIKKFEPNAKIKVASKGIFSINIQSNNKNIPQIFDYIEQSKERYGIEDYTVSSTTLEDVFLNININSNLDDLKYINKEKNENEPIKYYIPKASGFCTQLSSQIVRGLYPLIRNKTYFFFELLSGLGFVYLFIFFFSDMLSSATKRQLNLIDVLEENSIYIYEKKTEEDYLKNSDVYNFGKYITLKNIKEEPARDILDFINKASDQALANIAKGALYIEKTNSNNYLVYNTEIDNGLNGYFYANTILFFSAFLKNNYDIDAIIFPEINFDSFSGIDMSYFIDFILNSIILIIVCLISLLGYVIFLGGLMFEKIKEKRTNIKHLLYLSGSNIWSYWIGFFIVDYIKLFIFSVLLILPIFYVNGVALYFGLDMLVINFSSLVFIYFITFFCSKDDEGTKILFLVIIIVLIILAIIAISIGEKAREYISSFTKPYYPNIFDLTPLTSMGLSFIRLIYSYSIDKIMEEMGSEKIFISLMLKESLGLESFPLYLYTSYIAQALNLILYSLLLILAESGLLVKLIHIIKVKLYGNKKNYVYHKSEDCNAENIKVYAHYDFNYPKIEHPSDPLQNPYVQKQISKVEGGKELTTRIKGLTKTFYACCGCCCCSKKKDVLAINNLYLGLEPNEKFGLLGFNGSGKTTTFRAITNEILTDSGSITIFGYDTKKQFEHIRTIIGYCPQINPLFDYMKVKEIIEFYSKLKTCNETVESVCQKFGLSKYLNTNTINLSGGNKRKLTFAIALMNKPRLLLLDEPSTGVDPESRRIMWRNINELSNNGHKYNMILTTHSMEEAEVLCDTVSWLKAGNFITVGNPEELKIQYSAGYNLHIKFDDLEINNNLDKNIYSIQDTFNNVSTMIGGMNVYSDYILANKDFEPYLRNLFDVIKKIKDKTKNISLKFIGKDYSFELEISIIKEKQKNLFSEVLNMKNSNKIISEMSISMQSLENILTSL